MSSKSFTQFNQKPYSIEVMIKSKKQDNLGQNKDWLKNSKINMNIEGKQISMGGTENSDGSYTAKTIQLRPLDSNQ